MTTVTALVAILSAARAEPRKLIVCGGGGGNSVQDRNVNRCPLNLCSRHSDYTSHPDGTSGGYEMTSTNRSITFSLTNGTWA